MLGSTKTKKDNNAVVGKVLRGLMTTLALLGFTLTTAPKTHAHPVDVEVIQKQYADLGHDDPEFAQCWQEYWHWRREFVVESVRYGECVGQLRLLVDATGFDRGLLGIIRQDILDYYSVIPAMPVVEQSARLGASGFDIFSGATRMDYCRANIDAAQHSLNEAITWHGHCEFWVGQLRGLLR